MSAMERFHTQLMLNHVPHTKARDAIFQAILRLGPCSLRQLQLALHAQVGQTTIYRTLTKFQQINVITQIRPDFYQATDVFIQHHHEFICRNCNRRIGFYHTPLEQVLTRLASHRRFSLEDHQLSLTGLCQFCATNPALKPRPALIPGAVYRRPHR